MKNHHYQLAKSISSFLSDYLPCQRKLSQNTVHSYRDTFILLFRFFDEKGIKTEKITFDHITYENVTDFMKWLENTRQCSDLTINQRLAAIHSYVRYVFLEYPEYIYDFQRILHIQFKKTKQNIVNYLSEDQMKTILSAPNSKEKKGIRDQALLCLLYDSAARIQEIIDIKVKDIRCSKNGSVTLTGKGNKSRVVPLTDNTVSIIKRYLRTYDLLKNPESYLFHHKGEKFTRPGITYIIRKHSKVMKKKNNIQFNITPHIFRHSKSMHMLHAGINLYYIKEILGHSSLTTTEKFYIRADSEFKRKELQKMKNIIEESETDSEKGSWETDKSLLDWLNSL